MLEYGEADSALRQSEGTWRDEVGKEGNEGVLKRGGESEKSTQHSESEVKNNHRAYARREVD